MAIRIVSSACSDFLGDRRIALMYLTKKQSEWVSYEKNLTSIFEMLPFLYLRCFSLKRSNLTTGECARYENAFESFRGSLSNIFIVLFSHLLWWEAAWEGRGQFRKVALSLVQGVEITPYLLQNSFLPKMPLPKSLFSIKKNPNQTKRFKGTKRIRINFLNSFKMSWI